MFSQQSQINKINYSVLRIPYLRGWIQKPTTERLLPISLLALPHTLRWSPSGWRPRHQWSPMSTTVKGLGKLLDFRHTQINSLRHRQTFWKEWVNGTDRTTNDYRWCARMNCRRSWQGLSSSAMATASVSLHQKHHRESSGEVQGRTELRSDSNLQLWNDRREAGYSA